MHEAYVTTATKAFRICSDSDRVLPADMTILCRARLCGSAQAFREFFQGFGSVTERDSICFRFRTSIPRRRNSPSEASGVTLIAYSSHNDIVDWGIRATVPEADETATPITFNIRSHNGRILQAKIAITDGFGLSRVSAFNIFLTSTSCLPFLNHCSLMMRNLAQL